MHNVHYILPIIAVMLLSTLVVDAPVKYPDPVGSYVSEDSLRVLILEEDGSYILRSTIASERRRIPSKIYTPENWTLSYGSWRQEGSFVVLKANDDMVGDIIEMQVDDKVTDSDSLLFMFESPCISDEACRSEYSCEIWVTGLPGGHQFDCVSFVIPKDTVSRFPDFAFVAIPQALQKRPYSIQYNRLYSFPRSPRGFESNEFVVRLDKFTPEYIYYIRFLNEYMPVDESGIYVRGVRYTKRAE